ncbi:MAG TPA: GAF domain-containing sensor histidine kinase, partial [Anaerolineae bacterium]|nr:GAF domain-containing sensor histidine kinase [Anaerolineae bacterium]
GVSDAESLASLLLGQLVDILRLNGAILLLGNEEGKLVVTKTRGFDVLSFSDLSLTGALAAPLQSADSPLSSFELRDGLESANLTEEELAYLTSPHIHLWVPLVRQGNLQGVLLLGARPGDEPFEPEDRRILGTLANQAGIATENIRLIQVLHHRASEAKKLYSQLLHTREDERKRLARELHDQIIQDLINLHFRLDVDAPRFSSDAAEQSQALRRLVQALIEELRAICTELRPAAIDDLSLSLAVQGYVEEFSQLNGLNIELCLPENGYALTSGLPEHTSLSLFRVLQEGLNNVRRHAHATQIQVNLTVEAGRVILEIRDNGQGFVLPRRLGSFVQQKHFGLVGLQEHVDTVGGELAIQSSPGQGTVLRASVPTVT